MNAIIETERLILREFIPEDSDWLAEMHADPEVMEFSATGTMNQEKSDEYISYLRTHYEKFGAGIWAVIEKSSGLPVGRIGLPTWEYPEGNETEIAYRLLRQFWGQGFATEAGIGCKKYGFEVMGKRTLFSYVERENINSVKVAERMGMTLTGKRDFRNFSVDVYSVNAATD